jgi:hypothetical protein
MNQKPIINSPFGDYIEENLEENGEPFYGPGKKYKKKDLLRTLITDASRIKPPEPIVKIRDSNFAVKGDFSIVGGLPKVGKTTICSFMIATAFMKAIPDDFDSLGIRTTFCEGKPVVYIDTEQPQAYTNQLRENIKKLLGLDKQPENLHIANLRKFDSKEKNEIVLAMMDLMPDCHLWIIDGIADLVSDPNDVKESFKCIERFMMKSDELNTTIILHLHENPGGGKLRGNLGSEAERKCGGAITIKKDKEKGIHYIEPKVIRGTSDFEKVYFRYSTLEKRMVSLSAEDEQILNSQSDPEEIKRNKRHRLALKITVDGKEILQYKDAITKIMEFSKIIEGRPIKERTADNRLKEMLEMDFLSKNDNGQYELNK